MCDYRLMHIKSRPASVGDKLRTSNFGTGTRGFAAPSDPGTAVCVLPGTELAFNSEIAVYGASAPSRHKTAIFRQINRDQPHMHHDALELPDGQTLLLTFLCEGQEATVLQFRRASNRPRRRNAWPLRAKFRVISARGFSLVRVPSGMALFAHQG